MERRLLVASPGLNDPNFRRSVVLVAEHTDEGAMGLVLNRPSTLDVTEAIPPLAGLAGDDPLWVGGPVQPRSVLVLAEFTDPDAAGTLVLGSIGLASGTADLGSLRATTRRVRAFAGYAGWGAGQLDAELENEDWIVCDPRESDLFTERPEGLWGRVLERRGGHYALLARMPEDPSLN